MTSFWIGENTDSILIDWALVAFGGCLEGVVLEFIFTSSVVGLFRITSSKNYEHILKT